MHIGETTTRLPRVSAAQAEGLWNIGGTGVVPAGLAGRGGGEPAVEIVGVAWSRSFWLAWPTLAAGEHGEGELFGSMPT